MEDTPAQPRDSSPPIPGRENTTLALRYNHPKNYVGVPLAIVAERPTADVIADILVADTTAVIRGATALGLVDASMCPSDKLSLTSLGEDLIAPVTADRSPEAALDALSRLQGSTDRFVDVGSRYWEPFLTQVYQQYPPAATLVTALNQTGPASLARLTAYCLSHNQEAARLLVSATNALTPIDPSQPLGQTSLADYQTYYSPTTCQLKTQLWHAGILTERGAHSTALAPLSNRWALEPRHLSTSNSDRLGGPR